MPPNVLKRPQNIKVHFTLNIMSPFLLAVTVLVVINGFPLFGHPWENGYCSFRDFYLKTPFGQYQNKYKKKKNN